MSNGTNAAVPKPPNKMDAGLAQRQHEARETLKQIETDRPSLRDVLLGRPRDRELVPLKEYGRDVLVLAPTVAIRDEYLNRLDLGVDVPKPDEDGKPQKVATAQITIGGSTLKAHVWLVIGCAYDPDTADDPKGPKRLFNGNDEKTLMNTPSTGFVKHVAAAAIRLMKESEEAAKNLNAIQTDSSSSGSQSPSEDAPSGS